MDEEIVLDRGRTNVMKLDADEQALMDEIEISVPRPKPVPRPTTRPMQRPGASHHQEAMDAFVNPNKQSAPAQPREDEEIDYGEDEPMMFDDEPMGPGPDEQAEQPSKGYTSIDEEKSDLINKLTRLEKKGFAVNKRLNAYSSIDELRSEVKRITYSIDVEQSIRFSRRMLIACVTGLEFLNKRYNPFEIQLEGWSESVMENVDDYGVFEEFTCVSLEGHVVPEFVYHDAWWFSDDVPPTNSMFVGHAQHERCHQESRPREEHDGGGPEYHVPPRAPWTSVLEARSI